MAKIKVTQNRNGKRVTFLTEDKGKPGKTPKSDQWYNPKIHTDWEKDMPEKHILRRYFAGSVTQEALTFWEWIHRQVSPRPLDYP